MDAAKLVELAAMLASHGSILVGAEGRHCLIKAGGCEYAAHLLQNAHPSRIQTADIAFGCGNSTVAAVKELVQRMDLAAKIPPFAAHSRSRRANTVRFKTGPRYEPGVGTKRP